jgi:flagellar motility protein MotE (MotC chaperone)
MAAGIILKGGIIMRQIMVVILLLAAPAICSAEIYKWTDEKGQVGYADDLGKVPTKYRDSALVTEKQDQAVEVIEKIEPDKSSRKNSDLRSDATEDKNKGKAKTLYNDKDGDSWKQDFARLKYEIKSLEDRLASVKERLAEGNNLSRGDFLSLQVTQRDLDVQIAKAKKKLDALIEAADKADLPNDFR